MTHEIRTHTGRMIDVTNPKPEDIDIRDIAFGLSNICRFNGQVPFYSVAEHSLAVANSLSHHRGSVKTAALLHDASEAYIGDVSTPLKSVLPDYQVIEAKWTAAINARFDIELTPQQQSLIKAADEAALRDEYELLFALGSPNYLVKRVVLAEGFSHKNPEQTRQEFLEQASRWALVV